MICDCFSTISTRVMMNRVHVLEAQAGEFSPSVVVLGSCFMDYIAYVDHVPQIGETMHSQSFLKSFGGKGANQAVAVSKMGSRTAMVGMLGNDGDALAYTRQLNDNGVNTTFMMRDDTQASGLAMIFVDTKTSNNEIVICPNATKLLLPDLLRARTQNYNAIFTKSVKFLICQNEIPLATTLDALRAAHERGIYTVFNTAPAPSAEDVERIKPYLRYVSLFCPNEVEAAMLTGFPIVDTESAFRAVVQLQGLGIADVVITLGKAGFVLAEKNKKPVHIPGKRVKAVDTTGAGDCFVGTMVHYLNKGHTLLDSCKLANICAAYSVTRKGTQISYPSAEDLKKWSC